MITRCERCGVPAEDVFCVDCIEVDPGMWQDAVKARRQRLNTINLAWLERRLEAGWLLKELAQQLRVSEHALGRWHRLRCTREHRRPRDQRTTA